jgi:cardiolipin synthase
VTPLALWHTAWEVVAVWAYWAGLALGLVMVPVILASRRLPQAKIAWILGVLGFPWFGSLLYAVVGRQRLVRTVLRRRGATVEVLSPLDARHHGSGVVAWRPRKPSASRDMVEGVEHAGAHPPVPGNRLEIHAEGDVGFASASAAVRAARRHVHLCVYIFKDDRTGLATLDLLADAARRGVEVRVLYDAFGTFATKGGFFDPLKAAGARVAPFLPASLFRGALRANLRNHRKLLVVDGDVAFTGGRNVGDEYAREPKWRDLHVRVQGPVVPTLQRVFAEDWHFATGELLEAEGYYGPVAEAGDVPVQVVESGPDQDGPAAEELMFGALASARTCVDVATPYLVPTEAIEQALVSCARRGKRVRILLPDDVDHRVVRWASDAYLPRLLDAGVEVWRRPGMFHAKAVIVDRSWATTGSVNLDARSLRLNFELNLAFPHAPTAERVLAWFEGEMAVSRRIAMADLDGPFSTRLARAGAFLLAPVL